MFGVALLMSTLLALADARIYERCELARDLLSLGIKKEHLATWVCIAYHESRFDTAARNPSSGDHGLLQISEIYWCGAGKVCGLPCSALRDEDISDDVECALRIYDEHTRLQGNGFLAWVVYPHHCKHNAKKYLADCESSVKSSSVRADGRARVLKSQNRNYSTATLPYNANIDKLLPPYLTVGSLLRGNYEKVFEENYIEHGKVDWVNYKLDNVDELKLPVFNQKVSERYTSTTSLASTSTTPGPLPNIKPPSPRRIESNSFRRRKNRPLKELNDKITETTKIPTIPPRILSSTVAPLHKSTLSLSTNNRVLEKNILNPTTKPAATLLYTTTTIKPSSKNIDYFAPFTSRTAKTKNPVLIETSTFPTELVKAKPRNRIITQPVSVLTIDTDKASPAVKESPNELISSSSEDKKPTLKQVLPSVALKAASTSILDSKIKESEYTAHTAKPEVTTSTTKKPTVANVHKSSIIYDGNRLQPPSTTSKPSSRSWPTWSTSRTRTTSTTPRPSTVNWRTAKSWSSRFKETVSATISTSMSTTPPTQHQRQVMPKSTSLLISDNNNTATTKGSLVQITTSKPRTTWPSYGRTVSRSSPTPVTTSKTRTTTTKIVTSTESPAPTTARTTQSIFDLYLNPTTRAKLPAFSFPPFKSSGHSLKIFAGGTTTITPSILSKTETKNPSGEATKNQFRRHA